MTDPSSSSSSPSVPPTNPVSSVADRSSGPAPQRPQPPVWGPSQTQSSTTRRGLTPLSTSFPSLPSRPSSSSQSPAPRANPLSPTASSAFPSLGPPANRIPARSASISSNNSSFSPPPQPAQQQSQTSALLPGRSRTIASSSNPQLASAAAASQGGGLGAGNGGSGGSSKNVRASPSLSQSSFGSPTSSSNLASQGAAQSGQLTKIVVAQIFLLLSTMKEDKDKTKWESQADQLRKLVESNPPEVFMKYFRRLLSIHASQIWGGGGRSNSDNYQLLVEEVQKLTEDPSKAPNMAEAIEYGEGDVFKDFDLSTFMEHFKMNSLTKVILASAFKRTNKPDLRSKADAILMSNITSFLNVIANSAPSSSDQTEYRYRELLASVVDRLAQESIRNFTGDLQTILIQAFQQRYAGSILPLEISSALFQFDLLNDSNPLVRRIQRHGPKCTESLETCKSMLEGAELRDISYQQVANSLLFMIIARDNPSYDPTIFISALREHRGGQRLDWQDVVHAFDRDGLQITKSQFQKLFNALLPLALEYENFDIQLLWGGDWRNDHTQLAFASAFLSCSEEEMDADKIPRLRKAFTKEDFQDASQEVKDYAEKALHRPLVSADATKALFNLVFRNSTTYSYAQSLGVIDNVINHQMDLFVCSVSAVPKPWGALQDQAMRQLIEPFIYKTASNHAFVLYLLWRRDQAWLAQRIHQVYQRNTMHLIEIFEHARDLSWLDDLIGFNNELSLDLAALAHGRNLFDLDRWLDEIVNQMPKEGLLTALSRFLNNKAEDDIRCHRDGSPPATVPLTIKTVHSLLSFLGNGGLPEEDRTILGRLCIQAYPRLINYGEGYDEIVEANGRDGNALSPEADSRMQEHYKNMYSGESSVQDIVDVLQRYKHSQDPVEQDLFACMIYGLFDEYNCFGEYPLDALATTAVLFGGIIGYNLLSRIALQVALAMVLEAVRDYQPEDSMYKFGLQALINCQDRLVEWKKLSEHLYNVPGLQGTPIYPGLERIVHEDREGAGGDSKEAEIVNGAADDFLGSRSDMANFTCLSADPPLRENFYDDPDEQVQENVLFILNNVSERNLESKTNDLKNKLQEDHHQWFANYLVESRIKPQPNFQPLYRDLLDEFGSSILWAEVLRESYLGAINMLNSESTMNSSNERTHLKNLGGWLGSITLARNHSIKHKNISFRELLQEAYDTQRLPVVIPFICKVLAAAAQSPVFRPPCAWTMEIVQILLELYNFAELKLNLKFEIEVLCNALEVDHKEIEPSDTIRSRPVQADDMLPAAISDRMEGFNDLSLVGFNSRSRGWTERFSPSQMAPELADLSSSLKHNYSLPPSSPAIQSRIRQILSTAAERAVSEIIGPVVERSVTIAAISTHQLIAKDFALEPDATRFQESAHTAVRSLAGSLAGVTCKEPLRTSMTAQIQQMRQDLPEQALPSGSILMFVNDNLDNVCGYVEKAAETASINEIDAQIEEQLAARKRTNFEEGSVSNWAFYIPEPYKPRSGGLNREQMSIYEDFGKTARSLPAHSSAMSQDGGRQLPDVLQDPFASVPPLTTPSAQSEGPSIGRAIQHHQSTQPPSVGAPATTTPQMVNGYVEGQHVTERISDVINGFHRAAQEAVEEDPSRHLSESPAVQDWWNQVRENIVAVAPIEKDHVAILAATEIAKLLYQDNQKKPVIELFAQVLRKLCGVSESTAQMVHQWCTNLDETRLFYPAITSALIKSELLDVHRVDLLTARSLHQRHPSALFFFRELVENTLLTDPPAALHADFRNSMAALAQWLTENPSLEVGDELLHILQSSPSNLEHTTEDLSGVKVAQGDYIFDEWVRLQLQDAPAASLASFAQQLYLKDILSNKEDSAVFFRASVDSAVAAFEREEENPEVHIEDAYMRVDALAKLVTHIVAHQGKVNGSDESYKVAYFDGILSLLILVLSQHYAKRGNMFNQKVFFRLFSTVLCEVHTNPMFDGQQQEMMFAFGRALLMLQPKTFPGFSYAWLSLISHRLLVPHLLVPQEEEGWDIYCELLEKLMLYLGEITMSFNIPLAPRDLYRGTLKLLLLLHHDFPTFLAENHFRLLSHISPQDTQLRSLIVSASPITVSDVPDAFAEGLKVDRIDDIRRSPIILGNLEEPLEVAGIKALIDDFINGRRSSNDAIDNIATQVSSSSSRDTVLLNAILLYLVKQIENGSHHDPLSFSPNTLHTRFLERLMDRLSAEDRYHLFSAMINQLRWPNSHTQYFAYALLHLFRPGQADREALEIQQQIIRTLLERLIVHRPHPWGLLVTTLELLKNGSYRFWHLPFIKQAPELERMFQNLFQQMAQSSRSMA